MLGTLGIQSSQAQVFTHIRSSAATEAASPGGIDPSPCPLALAEATVRDDACSEDTKGYILGSAGLRERSEPKGRLQAVVHPTPCKALSRSVPSPSTRTGL